MAIKRMKEYTPEQVMMLTLDPDRQFPNGSFERFLVDTVKDLNIDELTIEIKDKKDLGGQTSYNPRSLLAIIFYAYSNGVFSARKMADLCNDDFRYMYVSGFNAPEHSTLSRFIINNEKFTEKIFTQILYIADNMRYVNYKIIVTDGSKIKANAASKFTGTIKDFKKRSKKLTKKIQLAIQKQKETDNNEQQEYWTKKEERYKNNKNKIDEFLKSAEPVYLKDRNKEMKQNITDPDCRLVKDKQEICEGYNANISVCEKNGLIIANEVTNKATDVNMFSEMVEKVNETLEVNNVKTPDNAKYLNDAGYYSMDNLMYSDSKALDVYIPDTQDKNVYLDREKDDSKTRTSGKTSKCTIEIKNDGKKLICPGGRELNKKEKIKNQKYYVFCIPDLEHRTT